MDIAITALIASLILLVEHWFPWRLVLRRELPRPLAYTLGVLALVLPLLGLYLIWGVTRTAFDAAVALVVVVMAGGAAVLGAYWLDGQIAGLAEYIADLQVRGSAG